MPSLYKFYNKTATGLQQTFNTLKTALPGNEKLDEKTTTLVDGINWQFVPDNKVRCFRARNFAKFYYLSWIVFRKTAYSKEWKRCCPREEIIA